MKFHSQLKQAAFYLAVLSIGALSFLLVIGPQVLNPENISWLKGDASQHYQGWAFYRASDWMLPLGANPKFGLLNNSSVVYSDSIPLLAIFFKIFRNLLTENFQYLGIWTLVCFMLQAFFSVKLLGVFTRNKLVMVLGATLFVFSCPMLYRIALHTSLVSHFLIVWAIYLYFRSASGRCIFGWLSILTVSALIHFYMFSMVAYLWVLSFFCLDHGDRSNWPRKFLIEIMVILGFEVIIFWQAGYFLSASSSITSSGYGAYPVNLLAIFDSYGWSYVLPNITPLKGFEEGFSYLGLGGLLLMVASIPALAYQFWNTGVKSMTMQWKVLLLGAIPLLAFSLTNHIHVGIFEFSYDLPGKIIDVFGILRSSSRLFWPILYITLLSTILLVIRFYRKSMVIIIMATAACLQIIDTSSGWMPYKKKIVSLSFEKEVNKFTSSFWKISSQHYKEFISIPPAVLDQDISLYAANNGFALNYVPIARNNGNDVEINNKNTLSLKSTPVAGAIYFLPTWKARPDVEISEKNLKDGLLASVGPYTIFAPNWKKINQNAYGYGHVSGFSELKSFSPVVTIDESIDFSVPSIAEQFLLSGWGAIESLGPWADASEARIILPIPDTKNNLILTFDIRAYVNRLHPIQRVQLTANSGYKFEYTFNVNSNNIISIPLPYENRPKYVDINLKFLDVVRPIDLDIGESGDANYSIGIKRAVFTRAK